jgi:hypothetical protein
MPSVDELPDIRPRIIEIVGPASTGKTTLFHNMLCRYGDAIIGKPRLRRLQYLPLFVSEAIALAPLISSVGRSWGSTAQERVSKMIYLHVLARVLQRDAPGIAKVQLLDQGPVYLLAKLRERRPPGPIHPRLASWERASLDTWASLLDAVVWLDAPDVLLLERIDSRVKPHALKGSSTRHAHEVLAQARRLSESIISELSDRSDGFAVQHLDTSRHSAAEIVCAVATTCGLTHPPDATSYHERSCS